MHVIHKTIASVMHWQGLVLIIFSFEILIQASAATYILDKSQKASSLVKKRGNAESSSLYPRSPIPGTTPSRPAPPPPRRKPRPKAHQSGRQLTRAEALAVGNDAGARLRRGGGPGMQTLPPIQTPFIPPTPAPSRQRPAALPELIRTQTGSSELGTPRRGNSLPPLPSFPSSVATPSTSTGTPPLRYSPPRPLRSPQTQQIARSSSQASQVSSIGSESVVGRRTRHMPTPFGSPGAQALGAIPKGPISPVAMSESGSVSSGCFGCCFGGICS